MSKSQAQEARDKKYWQDRFAQFHESQLDRGQQYYYEVEEQIMKAEASLQREINQWYHRLAVNNNISFVDAKKLITNSDLKEFKWTVEEYVKYGKENAIDQSWMKELENASARVHITQLEAIQYQLQQQIEVLYGNYSDGLDKRMRELYSNGYYHTAYEIQRGLNVGWDLQTIDKNKIEQVISKPWTGDGVNFSQRLWKDKKSLINAVHTQLTQAIMRGDGPQNAINAIAKQFKTTKNQAGRLIMTESAYFASTAQKDCYADLDVEKFEVVATLDSHTSEICQSLDGKIVPMKDYQAGVTAPPFHAWCRSITVPYFDDNYTERVARDKDGNLYYVPGDMKYPEWKKSFVDGGTTNKIKPIEHLKDTSHESIIKTLEKYEKTIVHEEVENAIVITKDSDVFRIIGSSDYIDLTCIGDLIYGASVTHNHPSNFTEYSLSSEDVAAFEKYELSILRGIDDKYTYELNRNGIVNVNTEVFAVDVEPEDYQHYNVANTAIERGYGYWRKKVEKTNLLERQMN